MNLAVETSPPAEVLAAIRRPFEAFGGQWIEAPVLQPLAQLLDLAGEAMRARLFVVEGEGAGGALALRPDFTIPVAEAHRASGAASGRYLYSGKVFRAAPGGAKAAEVLQIGCELFGPSEDPVSDDAAVAAVAYAAAVEGGRKDLALHFGDVSLFAGFLTALALPEIAAARLLRAFAAGQPIERELAAQGAEGQPQGRLAGLLSGLPEAEAAGVLEELWALAGIQPVGGRGPAEIVHRLAARGEAARGPRVSPAEAELIRRYLAVSAFPRIALDRVEALAREADATLEHLMEGWTRRLKALDAAGAPEARMTLATGFVRPFGYYDGLFFEVRSEALGPERAIAAGGRYDGLPARLGSAPGAVGCMIRPARAWAGAQK
jgi:ATP phosphoribosyltransferase regulatory subunit